jgi:spore germination protein KB
VKLLKEEKISSYQMVMLIAGYFLGSSIILNPAAQDGADAWFTGLVNIAVGFLIVSITATLAMLYPGKSLVEILILCFGRTMGRIIGFFYLIFAIWLSGVTLLTFSNYSTSVSYPETPILFISICYMLIIAFAVKIGLEAMGRISEVLIVLAILISIVALLSLVTDFHPDAFLPLFKNGIAKPAVSGLMGGVLPFAEVFLALNILPNLNDKKKTFKSLTLAMLVAGGVMYLFTVRNISVLGVNMASRNVFPSEKVFRLMPVIDIIPLLDINVIVFGILKVSLALYAQAKILGDIFGFKEFKIYVLPLAALDIIVSNTLYPDFITQLYVANNIVPLMYVPVLVVMPLIMLIISLIKKNNPNEQLLKLE